MDGSNPMMEQALALAASNAAQPKAMNKGAINLEKAREAAQEFEAVFISQMLKPMFEGMESDGPFGGGQAEAINRSMMVEEYGKQIAKSGGVGLADNVMAEILKMQETQ
jgi:Rod binding domain-containing protein